MRTREATAEMVNGDRLGTVVVEADTAEMAMERLVDELGDDVRIIDARKIRRGGVGGFFSRELVQLTAEVQHDTDEAASFGELLAAQTGGADQAPAAVADSQMASPSTLISHSQPRPAPAPSFAHDDGDIAAKALVASQITFAPQPAPPADMPISIDLRVRPELDDDIEVYEPDPEPQSTAELVFERVAALPGEQAAEAARPLSKHGLPRAAHDDGRGAIDWGTTSLVRLGLSTPLINALSGVDRTDDLACLHALAEAIAPLCGPITTDDTVVIGKLTWGVAMLMDMQVAAPGDALEPGVPVAIDTDGAAADRAWLDTAAADRELHLVLGNDDSWRRLLFRSPRHVSWTARDSVIDALYVASTLDATLAYGVTTDDGELLPARPLDIAIAVRDLMGRSW